MVELNRATCTTQAALLLGLYDWDRVNTRSLHTDLVGYPTQA
jgi:hypothetical protein